GSERLSGLSHAQRSMDTAVSAAYCGKPGLASSRYSIYMFLKERSDLMSQPFRNVMAAQAVSLSNYCATVDTPIVVEETSLSWLERLMIRWNARMTPDGLGRSLGALRLLIIGVFGLGLLRTGSSILFTTAAVLLAGDVAEGLRDTAYPFA